jgi:hypothetical protein
MMACVYDEPRAGFDDQQPRGEPAGWRGPNGYQRAERRALAVVRI